MSIRKILSLLILIALVFVPFTADAATKAKKKKTVRKVEIQMKDEMILTGTLTMPESANIHAKVPLVILLHSLGSNRDVYIPLSNELKKKNIASLALDARGHHNSTTKLSGKKSYWQNYATKIYAKYPDDIVESANYMKEHYSAIASDRIAILGADINANAAAIAAANQKCNVKNLVLISPTMTFKGLAPSKSIMAYGNKPVMIIASKKDVYHYKEAIILSKYSSGKVNFITTESGGTGDNILKVNPKLNNTIADWLSKNL